MKLRKINNMKTPPIPVLYKQKDECCGCTACEKVCKINAISMCLDDEGFLYPVINSNKCVKCFNCVNICALKKDQAKKKTNIKYLENYNYHLFPITYAVKHKDLEVRKSSQSGGIFTAISDYILKNEGIVYGCVLTTEFKAVHVRVTETENRNLMRGSKYIQSELKNTFPEVHQDLLEGKKVLFTGTSCQVAALSSYLKHDYENLICMDIICHGVPSPKIWTDYIKWQESKYSSKCIRANFRDKEKHPWKFHYESLKFENCKEYDGQIFKEIFYGNRVLRPSCYQCPYSSIYHPGDITFGDFWGIEKRMPKYLDDYGCSLVFVNTEKGKKVFNSCSDELDYHLSNTQDCMQPMLKKPASRPAKRAQFWDEYTKKGFEYIAKKYGGYGIRGKLKKHVGHYINTIKSSTKLLK